MPLHPHLAFYAYQTASNGRTDYAAQIESLSFTTIAPGGFGDLSCDLVVKDSRIVPPELTAFANIALMDGPFAVFLGRLDQPEIALDDQGTKFHLTAQGGATNLKDDPQTTAYTSQTGLQVITDQLTSSVLKRNKTCLLDSDTSGISLPAGNLTIAFNSQTMEDTLNKILPILGDCTYAVWDHPTHKDAAGFPTWQLSAHTRDTSSANLAYSATLSDEGGHSITPAVELAFNVIQVAYKDATTLIPSSVTVTDSRLNNDGSQGTAPFPWRKMKQDKSGVTMSATQAAAIANALLAQYQNINYKISVDVASVRDANGNPIPLWQVRADKLILIPELATIGVTLPTGYTLNTNMFYITQTSYAEGSGQAPKLTLTSSTFDDAIDWQIKRLEMAEEQRQMNQTTSGTVQTPGVPEVGQCGLTAPSIATAGNIFAVDINFKSTMFNTPTSITLSPTSQTNVTSVTATNLSRSGFTFALTTTSNGAAAWHGTYTTNGN